MNLRRILKPLRGSLEAQIGLLQSRTNEFKTCFKTLRGSPEDYYRVGQMNLRPFSNLEGKSRSPNRTITESDK